MANQQARMLFLGFGKYGLLTGSMRSSRSLARSAVAAGARSCGSTGSSRRSSRLERRRRSSRRWAPSRKASGPGAPGGRRSDTLSCSPTTLDRRRASRRWRSRRRPQAARVHVAPRRSRRRHLRSRPTRRRIRQATRTAAGPRTARCSGHRERSTSIARTGSTGVRTSSASPRESAQLSCSEPSSHARPRDDA